MKWTILILAACGLIGCSSVPSHDQERDYYLHQYKSEIKLCVDKGGIPIRDWSGYKMTDCQFPPLDMRH